MKLYLVQHGEAVPKESNPDRPLTERGMADVQRLAVYLSERNVTASRAVHSGKTRARQTAEAVAAVIAPRASVEAVEGLEPTASAELMATRLVEWTRDTVVVGHQPFLGRLASRLLCGGENGFSVAFVPGSAVCLERDADGAWHLNWMLRPEFVS